MTRVLLLRNCRGISEVTGGEAYILSLMASLDRARCEILLVCQVDPSHGETSWLRQLKARRLPFETIPVSHKGSFQDLFAVPEKIRRFGADIVYSMDHRSDIVGVAGAKITGKPAMAWFGGWTNWTESSIKGQLYAWADRQALKRAAVVVADSPYLAEQLDLGRSGAPIVAIPNGVDLQRFNPDTVSFDFKRELFGDEDVVVLGMVGRLHPNKGQLDFVKAAAALAHKYPACRFVICGGAAPGFEGYRAAIESLIAENKLGQTVRLLAVPASKVPEVIASLDIVMAPCHTESCSFAILEGMAMQKPIVAADAGGNPALVADGVNGLLVPPKNWEALRNSGEKLIAEPQLRAQFGQQARRRVEKEFSLQVMGDRTLQVFHEVISWHQGASGRVRSRDGLRRQFESMGLFCHYRGR